jgi:integrase
LPRERGNEGEQAHDNITILTPIQIKAFLEKVENHKYKVLFMLAIFSGARQGELLGLKWSDIDWENSQIHIRRTFNNGRFFTTKTEGSHREIDIGLKVLTELKKWKLACPANELDLVLPNEDGKPIDHSNMVKRFYYPALESAE